MCLLVCDFFGWRFGGFARSLLAFPQKDFQLDGLCAGLRTFVHSQSASGDALIVGSTLYADLDVTSHNTTIHSDIDTKEVCRTKQLTIDINLRVWDGFFEGSLDSDLEQEEFSGTFLHTSTWRDGPPWRRSLVLGRLRANNRLLAERWFSTDDRLLARHGRGFACDGFFLEVGGEGFIIATQMGCDIDCLWSCLFFSQEGVEQDVVVWSWCLDTDLDTLSDFPFIVPHVESGDIGPTNECAVDVDERA